jgi:hypothetical protein
VEGSSERVLCDGGFLQPSDRCLIL